MKASFPEEYRAREQDKLRYRYPRGESYLDIIARLEPVIFEMERQKAPLLIIAHQVLFYLRRFLPFFAKTASPCLRRCVRHWFFRCKLTRVCQ